MKTIEQESIQSIQYKIRVDILPKIIEQLEKLNKKYTNKLKISGYEFSPYIYLQETNTKKRLFGIFETIVSNNRIIVETSISEKGIIVYVNDLSVYDTVKEEFMDFGKKYDESINELRFIKNEKYRAPPNGHKDKKI